MCGGSRGPEAATVSSLFPERDILVEAEELVDERAVEGTTDVEGARGTTEWEGAREREEGDDADAGLRQSDYSKALGSEEVTLPCLR